MRAQFWTVPSQRVTKQSIDIQGKLISMCEDAGLCVLHNDSEVGAAAYIVLRLCWTL